MSDETKTKTYDPSDVGLAIAGETIGTVDSFAYLGGAEADDTIAIRLAHLQDVRLARRALELGSIDLASLYKIALAVEFLLAGGHRG